MAYTTQNFKCKADLKRAIAAGWKVTAYQPNGDLTGSVVPLNGKITLEGPHYPAPHTWYAEATIEGGYITKVK